MQNKLETRNSLKTLKFRNRSLVLRFMRNAGAVSVNEISRATGLSKMTIHKIIDHYLKAGIINNAGKGVSTEEGGKKPNLFMFNADCRFIFVVRLAHDFLSTSIVNLRGDIVVESQMCPLPETGFDQVAAMIVDAFTAQVAAKGLEGKNCLTVVLGCDGIVDVENGVCMASYRRPGWGKNIPMRDRLQSLLPDDIPVHVDSWWRHLAYGQMHFSGGEKSNFFLICNSGDTVSGGMVAEGHVCRGATGFAGEIGHLIVSHDGGEECVCGGAGCLESLVAPGRLAEKVRNLRDSHSDSKLFCGSEGNGGVSLAAIGAAAVEGDALARLVLDGVIGHFATAVNNIVQICDPGRIVFLGDYARAGSYFLDALRSRVADVSHRGVDGQTCIDASSFDERCGVVGAAAHMTDTLFSGGQ